MTYRMKKWQKISTITLLMAGVITFNDSEFRSVDKHQIAVADTNVQTTDYEKLRNTWLNVNYGYNQYDENNDAMKKKFEATEKEATNLLSSMKTESDRKYLWENSKDLDTKSADMTRTYRNIEKIAEAMKHKNTKLNTPDNKNKVKDALEWLHKNAYGKEPTDKVKELTENFKNKTSRNTNLNWNDMDRVTYHNKGLDFAFGLSMTSKNVARYESINNENLKGWHTGAGMSYLYNSDVKHYRDNFWATADMKRLAGTTTIENEEPKGTDVKKSSKTFVGGTKFDDQHASIGMDFENQDKTLTAKKSYFILNDKIVFLGTGIKSTDSSKNPVTTIENRKTNGYTLYTDDKQTTASDNQDTNSVFLESTNKPKNNIGYHFLNKSKITVKKESHTGKWSDINKSQKSEDKTDEYYEVTQKHSDKDNKYGYVLYPGITKDNFKSKASQVTVVKQDDDFHVVKDNESVWAGVNYSDSAKTFEINGTKVEVKAKGMFILKKKNDKTYECSFYNPESTNPASDIESKISMTGYSITNKDTSTTNESGVRFELTK
ncbi:TPA: polysaccharide lyase family 8 super-sandwich domain-containing protein [Staphylococcus aureus]